MVNCWICREDKFCLPYRSNPKGVMGGAIVMLCKECKKKVDARPTRPWEKQKEVEKQLIEAKENE